MHWGRRSRPPPDGHCRGRYASYWNAYLLITEPHHNKWLKRYNYHRKWMHFILLNCFNWWYIVLIKSNLPNTVYTMKLQNKIDTEYLWPCSVENCELIKLQLLHNEWKSIIKGKGSGVSWVFIWYLPLSNSSIPLSNLFKFFFHTLTLIFSSHLYLVCSKLKCASSHNHSQLFLFCFWERIGPGRYQFSTHGNQIHWNFMRRFDLLSFIHQQYWEAKRTIQVEATNMRVSISSLSLIATFFIFKRGDVLAKDGKKLLLLL